MAANIRLTRPTPDNNRSRWPSADIWELVVRHLHQDLFEMSCGLEPGATKEVIRKHHAELLEFQIIGLTASWATVIGFMPGDSREIIEEIGETLRLHTVENGEDFQRKMERAAERYVFL